MTMARDIAKKNGGAPVGARQDQISVLNVLQMPDAAQAPSRVPNPLSFVKEGFITLTAVQANQVLLHAGYDGQRKISAAHVDVLADIMTRGGWEPKDKVDFAQFDGRLILVNGYHRMSAQVACGKAILWTVVIHPCVTLNEVRSLYYRFDTNTKIRGTAQVLNGINFAEQTGLAKTTAKALYEAIPFIAAGFSSDKRDADVLTNRVTDRRLSMATEYVKAAQMYEKCLGRQPAKTMAKFRTGGIAAVALVTLRYQPKMAMAFWSGAAANDGLRKGDPRLALYNDLMSRVRSVGSSVQAFFPPAYAWNAWFEGKEIKIIKVYARKRAYIAGTPFEE